MTTLHPRAFTVTVVWTLLLLYLGSVVHATESSLACPDWPTCFGSLVPEMTGGVFWEHLHRLVAGGLLLMWGLATWLVRREAPDRPGLFHAALVGLLLLLVQSLFGGLTVLFRLPDLVSTTHLALALLFLALATALASRSKGRWPHHPDVARILPGWGAAAAAMVFLQSVLGGLVRHMDAGLACPDAPLCLGQLVPPLDLNILITLHFLHRVLGVLTAAVIVGLAVWASLRAPAPARGWAIGAAALALVQVGLGFLSVLTALAVLPVSAHTLVAATLLAVLVHLTTSGRATVESEPHRERAAAAATTR